eukprot:m.19120 g.19120  ORF g.19120 m.19120 type:complete len:180 (-) comp12179_c0_seq1:117-656(-)
MMLSVLLLALLPCLAAAHGYSRSSPLEPTFNKNCTAKTATLSSYHLHVLFWTNNNDSIDAALTLRNEFNAHFHLQNEAGSHDICDSWPLPPNPPRLCIYPVDHGPAGPFLTSQYSWFVTPDVLTPTVAWILPRRGDLDVFVHPNSGCEEEDHFLWSMWSGTRWPLDPTQLHCDYPGCGL